MKKSTAKALRLREEINETIASTDNLMEEIGVTVDQLREVMERIAKMQQAQDGELSS